MGLQWLAQIAPTLASAFGGPLAGVAVEVASKALGLEPSATKTLLESSKLTADQLAQIRNAEIDLQKMEEQLGLNFAKLANDDRDSARKMQISTNSWLPGFLAITVTVGFFSILILLMTGVVHKGDEVMIMLGSLGTAWTGIIAFYFGSSAGSQRKDDLLHQSSPVKP
jgi:hypothetical protein